jgi:hypothetical protein
VPTIPKKTLTSLGFRKIQSAGSISRIKIREKFILEASLKVSSRSPLTKLTPKYQECSKMAVHLKPEPTKFKNAEIPILYSVTSSIWTSSILPKSSGNSNED